MSAFTKIRLQAPTRSTHVPTSTDHSEVKTVKPEEVPQELKSNPCVHVCDKSLCVAACAKAGLYTNVNARTYRLAQLDRTIAEMEDFVERAR